MSDFKEKTIAGISWSLKTQLYSQFLSLASSIVLARLLTPQDFGLIAMITVLTGFASIFIDVGMGSALIQKQEVTLTDLSSVFWVNLALGVVFTLLLVASAKLISNFYQEPQLVQLTKFVSITFVINSLGIIHKTLLTKTLDFKTIFKVQFIARPLAIATAIVMAWKGFGAWSIATQMVLASIFTTVILWSYSNWRPRMVFDWSSIRNLWSFSLNLLGNSSMNYWVRNLDNLLIGKFIGTNSLGIYSKAYSFLTFPLRSISQVISKVLFPSLSKIQDDKKRVREVYLKISRAIALITFPLLITSLVLADSLVITLFGEQWKGMISIIRVFAVLGLFQSVGTIIGSLYLSQGRADLMFRVGIFLQILLISSIVIGLKWGILGVALCYTGATMISSFINHTYAGRLIDLKYHKILANLAGVFGCSVLVGMLVFTVDFFILSDAHSFIRLVSGTFISIIFYLLVIRSIKLEAYLEVSMILGERIGKMPTSKLTGKFKSFMNRLLKVKRKKESFDNLTYWEQRSTKYKEKAVLNLANFDRDMNEITELQIKETFPYLSDHLNGAEKVVLDFGCGPGRFSLPLAELVGGKTIGVDPVEAFLNMAPVTDKSEFRLFNNGTIPIEDGSIDLIWICLVFGGIRDNDLKLTLSEIHRVLRPGSLICLVENTSELPNAAHWYYRSIKEYQRLFHFASLKVVNEYEDVGEKISVLIGRVL